MDLKIAIIGGGPSGLAAYYTLSKYLDVDLFEQGEPIIDRKINDIDHLCNGIGGAGLYSDGKFSYFPSGSKLYKFLDQKLLLLSYQSLIDVLSKIGIPYERYPTYSTMSHECEGIKIYPSFYGTLDQRLELIQYFQSKQKNIYTQHYMKNINVIDNKYQLTLVNHKSNFTFTKKYDIIILATGKYGSLNIAKSSCTFNQTALKFEFGFRIEYPSNLGIFKNIQYPDLKYIKNFSEYEMRTFCTCNHGELLNIPVNGVMSLSGRVSNIKSCYSNFALLFRFTKENYTVGEKHWKDILKILNSGIILYEPLKQFIGYQKCNLKNTSQDKRPWFPSNKFIYKNIRKSINHDLYKIFFKGICNFLNDYPELIDDDTYCFFPAVEGVGIYPRIDNTLKIESQNIWIAGDLTGIFRGIIPSLLSGLYIGKQIIKKFNIN